MPVQHRYGRLSEEFGGALPSALIAEEQRLPVGFLDQVVEYRDAAAAYFANQVDPKSAERSPLRQLMAEIELDVAAEEIDAAHGEATN